MGGVRFFYTCPKTSPPGYGWKKQAPRLPTPWGRILNMFLRRNTSRLEVTRDLFESPRYTFLLKKTKQHNISYQKQTHHICDYTSPLKLGSSCLPLRTAVVAFRSTGLQTQSLVLPDFGPENRRWAGPAKWLSRRRVVRKGKAPETIFWFCFDDL